MKILQKSITEIELTTNSYHLLMEEIEGLFSEERATRHPITEVQVNPNKIRLEEVTEDHTDFYFNPGHRTIKIIAAEKEQPAIFHVVFIAEDIPLDRFIVFYNNWLILKTRDTETGLARAEIYPNVIQDKEFKRLFIEREV